MPQDYLLGLVGGLLVGAASVAMLLLNGRVLGVSGILGKMVTLAPGLRWRLAFLAGMVMVGAAAAAWAPASVAVTVSRSLGSCIVAGVLVGFGTQLGGGCTSGHGVCGIGRLSRRSILATVVFMATGAVSVYVVQHLLGGRI